MKVGTPIGGGGGILFPHPRYSRFAMNGHWSFKFIQARSDFFLGWAGSGFFWSLYSHLFSKDMWRRHLYSLNNIFSNLMRALPILRYTFRLPPRFQPHHFQRWILIVMLWLLHTLGSNGHAMAYFPGGGSGARLSRNLLGSTSCFVDQLRYRQKRIFSFFFFSFFFFCLSSQYTLIARLPR